VKRFDIISSFLSYFIIIIFIGVIENKYNYDYDSIMHYEWNAFSKFPGLRTTIRSKTGAKFGQRSHISVQDAFQINKYYKYECAKRQ